MKTILTYALFLGSFLSASAQDQSIINKHRYRIEVTLKSETISLRGKLYEVLDSAIVIASMKQWSLKPDQQIDLRNIPVSEIDKMKVYKKNKAAKSMLVGCLIGATTGALIGFVSGDDPPDDFISMTAGEKAAGVGLILGITGALIGALAGSGPDLKINLDGDQKVYSMYKRFLIPYSIKK